MDLTTRSLPIITHAFADAAVRDAFMTRLMRSDNPIGEVAFAKLALFEGRRALAAELGAMAVGQRSTGSRTVHKALADGRLSVDTVGSLLEARAGLSCGKDGRQILPPTPDGDSTG